MHYKCRVCVCADLGVVETTTVGRLIQDDSSGVVSLACQQPVARSLDGAVVPEPRQVEDGCSEEDETDGEASSSSVDVAAGVQRPADSEVPAERHVDRQPRTAHLKYVD